MARVFGKLEIAGRVVVVIVAAIGKTRPHPRGVIKPEAVAIPTVEIHRHARFGAGRSRNYVGGQLLGIDRDERAAARSGEDEHDFGVANGGNASLSSDFAGRDFAARGRQLDALRAAEQVQIGEKLGLNQFCLFFGIATDFQHRGRSIGGLPQRAAQRAVAAKPHGRQLLLDRPGRRRFGTGEL